jgi:hypothetical protein
MKYIKLFENWNDTPSLTRGLLSPQEIGKEGEVAVAWGMDGMCAALLSPEQASSLEELINSEDLATLPFKGIPAEGIAYVIGDSEGEHHFKGIEAQPETANASEWVGIEYTSNENDETEDVAMTLKRGHVTFLLASGHSVTSGQLPLDEFIAAHVYGKEGDI